MPIVIGIAGYSGAGKTTLIEALLPRLAARGWRVGVLKHDAHQLCLDREGKDTARFYAAGAAVVCAHDPSQRFVRVRQPGPTSLAAVRAELPEDLDLVLVEGHKDAPIARLVLEHPDERPAIEGADVLATVPWGPERLECAEELLVAAVEKAWRERPLGAAVFVGGSSRRMGLRKPLLEIGGRALVEHVVDQLRPVTEHIVLLGSSPLPRIVQDELAVLPDAPSVAGPLGGLLSLLRHDPGRAWLLVGCDQPDFGAEQAKLLVEVRRPGAWAVMAQLADRDRPEPFGAMAEPPLRPALERAATAGQSALYAVLAGVPSAVVRPPDALASGWHGVNTPEEWHALTGQEPREVAT